MALSWGSTHPARPPTLQPLASLKALPFSCQLRVVQSYEGEAAALKSRVGENTENVKLQLASDKNDALIINKYTSRY